MAIPMRPKTVMATTSPMPTFAPTGKALDCALCEAPGKEVVVFRPFRARRGAGKAFGREKFKGLVEIV